MDSQTRTHSSAAPAYLDAPDADGERFVAWLRLALALLGLCFAGIYFFVESGLIRPMLYQTAIILVAWALVSPVCLILIRRGRYRPWVAFVSTSSDVLLVSAIQVSWMTQFPLNFIHSPVSICFFLVVSLAALRKSRKIVVFAGLSAAVVHLAISSVGYYLFLPAPSFVVELVGFPVSLSIVDEVFISISLAIVGLIIGRVTRELRQSERHYQDLFENLPDGVLIVSEDAVIQTTNQRFADMLGISRRRLTGQKLTEFLPEGPDTESAPATPLIPTALLRPDGSTVPVRAVQQQVVYRGKACTEMSVRDVTDQIELEQQLAQAQKMETLGKLASGVAHDFNNVLGGILGASSLLERSVKRLPAQRAQEQMVQQISVIKACGERARDVVDRLLVFSRRQVLDTRPIDLNRVLADVATICRNTFADDYAIIVEPLSKDAVIEGDHTSLIQAVLNLCINARDAMPDGGTLKISASRKRPKGAIKESDSDMHTRASFLCIQVIDSGTGIAGEIREKIFDPFFTTKPAGEGTGLGLTQVYTTARQHGGLVEVDSEPGRGSTFNLYLAESRQRVAPENHRDTTLPRGEGTVLVVDDEEVMRSAVSGMLSELGYEVLSAKDGEEALRLLEAREGKVDLVLLDLVMPRLDGVQVLRRIRAMTTSPKVLVMSAHLNEERAKEIEQLSISGFLKKPFSISQVAHSVASTISRA